MGLAAGPPTGLEVPFDWETAEDFDPDAEREAFFRDMPRGMEAEARRAFAAEEAELRAWSTA